MTNGLTFAEIWMNFIWADAMPSCFSWELFSWELGVPRLAACLCGTLGVGEDEVEVVGRPFFTRAGGEELVSVDVVIEAGTDDVVVVVVVVFEDRLRLLVSVWES